MSKTVVLFLTIRRIFAASSRITGNAEERPANVDWYGSGELVCGELMFIAPFILPQRAVVRFAMHQDFRLA